MEFHPLANLFPLMLERDLDELAADIAEHGQREPIYIYEGKILDGRNRFRACRKLKREPWFEPWPFVGEPRKGESRDRDPLAFVVSMNLRRRHLDESQRALVAAKLASLKKGRPPSQREAPGEEVLENVADLNAPIGAFSIQAPPGVTMPAAARLLNVGRRSITRAREVLVHGDTALVAAVEAGEVSVWDAAKIVRKPKNIQQAALAAVQSGEAKTLAGAVKKLECEALSLDTLSTITDAQGNPLPETYLAIFAARQEFMAIARKLEEDRRAVEELAASPAGFYLRKELQHLSEKFNQIKFVVTHTAPYTVAPGKRNEPKWVTEIVWRTLTDDEKGGSERGVRTVEREDTTRNDAVMG